MRKTHPTNLTKNSLGGVTMFWNGVWSGHHAIFRLEDK